MVIKATDRRSRTLASDTAPDRLVNSDHWSDLGRHRQLPMIDAGKLHSYRMGRLKSAIDVANVAACVLVSPISLRYAVDYRTYALFQSHIPTTYLFVAKDGPVAIYGAYSRPCNVDAVRAGRPIAYFDGGDSLAEYAIAFADDVVGYLKELGTDNRRVAVEYVNPSITQALLRRGLEVVDAVGIVEQARRIKSEEEVACIEWSIAVAEHGIATMRQAVQPGVTENQLWALLNYANLANNGDWHDGRMLASGPRMNPWCQEASPRQVESGDLVGFDTDMVGPYGYCADISRTIHCGPTKPTRRQRQLYRLAQVEIEYNLQLIRPGISLVELQRDAYRQEEEFHEHAYPCVMHGVGMCDEYPRVNPLFRGPNPYDGTLEAGMVICVESFVGVPGEPDGVKLEQQVLVTEDGYRLLSHYPLEETLLN